MAKILVNPASLKSSAKQISSVSTLIQKSGETAWRSASGAPSYDGQFGPKVRAIAQAALARAKKQSASAKTLSSSLNKRASAFEAADAAAVKGLLKKAGAFNIYDPLYLRILAKLLGLTIAQILILLRLGVLRIPIGKFPWGKIPWWIIPPWKPFLPLIPPKKPRPVPAPKPPVKPKPKPIPPVEPIPPIQPSITPVSVINKEDGEVTQHYSSKHQAIDIGTYKKEGVPISASFVGKVVFSSDINCPNIPPGDDAQNSKVKSDASVNNGYGNVMIVEYKFDEQPAEIQKQWAEVYGIKSGQSLYALYAHLQHDSLKPAGTLVNPGDQIASVGNAGLSTGPHLHLAVKVGNSDKMKATPLYSNCGWYKFGNNVDPAKVDEFVPG